MGQTFTGTVVSPLRLNGSTVVPRGADALIRVAGIDKAGKLSGRASMELELEQVTVGGKHYPVKAAVKQVQGPAQIAEAAAKELGVGAAAWSGRRFLSSARSSITVLLEQAQAQRLAAPPV